MPTVDSEIITQNDVEGADVTVSYFTSVSESDQCLHLKIYLLSLGANVKEEVSDDLQTDLDDIIGGMDALLDNNQADAEEMRSALYSVCTLIIRSKQENLSGYISKICSIFEQNGKHDNAGIRLEILNTLSFCELTSNAEQVELYITSLKLAKQYKLYDRVITNIQDVSKQLDAWNIERDERIIVYRLIRDIFVESQRNDEAATVMLELLRSYDDSNIVGSKDDAKKCVVDALKNPEIYLFDYLLSLKPISNLRGDLIYDLLNIFVNEDLNSYNAFYEKNKDFLQSIGLSHEENLRKMRLLTLTAHIAKAGDVAHFNELAAALSLEEDDLEQYIIDAISCKLISAKIDEKERKVIVNWVKSRTFGKAELQQVGDRLRKWKNNMQLIRDNLLAIS